MHKKLLFAGVGLALAAVPLISFAQSTSATLSATVSPDIVTITTLRAEIQSLLAKIQALESGIASSSISAIINPIVSIGKPTTPACPSFVRSLSIGASGQDVTALQNFLSAQGFLSASSTGYFGVLTRAAVANWQAHNGVAVSGGAGAGIFGPLSRAFLVHSCPNTVTGVGTPVTVGTSTQGNPHNGGGNGNDNGNTNSGTSFTASPASGAAPLTVQFISKAPQGGNVGTTVSFGDGSQGKLAFVPVCSSCEAEGSVSHTYTTPGTYTAQLTGGMCACPANGICNCPNMMILGTATVTVASTSTSDGSGNGNIQQINAPGQVTLSQGGIAEIRNENLYFTLQSLTDSSATIQTTPVGCWNSFPSDPKPKIICMIAIFPIPPQTLTIGQTYDSGTRAITLTKIADNEATFSVTASSTVQTQ